MQNPTTIIRDVRPWGEPMCDVVIDGTAVSSILPHEAGVSTASAGTSPQPSADVTVIDGHGGIIVPAFSDVHLHLDSSRMGLPFRPYTGEPGRWGRIMNDRENWRHAERSVAERATYTLGIDIQHGATRIRSHAQVDADSGLEKIEGVLAAREHYADSANVEIVAFPQVGILLEPGVVDLMDQALSLGANLVGGIDPCEMDKDPVRHLDAVFGLAEKHQVGVDIHLHEAGELGLFTMSLILDRIEALGMQGHATISHARCLASGLPAVSSMIERLAADDVAITQIAPGKGWELPILDFASAGVRVGLGMDGQRDYWSPYGNGDMLSRTWQLAFTQGYSEDVLVEHALAVGTWGGATVIDKSLRRLDALGLHPGFDAGDPAEFVIFPGETPTSAVMDVPSDRLVVHEGRVVSRGEAVSYEH